MTFANPYSNPTASYSIKMHQTLMKQHIAEETPPVLAVKLQKGVCFIWIYMVHGCTWCTNISSFVATSFRMQRAMPFRGCSQDGSTLQLAAALPALPDQPLEAAFSLAQGLKGGE